MFCPHSSEQIAIIFSPYHHRSHEKNGLMLLHKWSWNRTHSKVTQDMYGSRETVNSWNKHGAFVRTGYNMKKHRAYRMHSKLSRVTNNFSNHCQTRVLCRGLEIRCNFTLQADASGQSTFMKGLDIYYIRQMPSIWHFVITFLCQPLITDCEC